MTSNQIRRQFLDFFEGKGHAIVESSPVVPLDDPTLMFTNAGMNQFKDVFLGTGSRPYKRAADTQKCIRAGGKHNDLDDVGRDTYHHTFFEMLGNWSFGDYFKKEAIEWAWELLTKVWGIPKDRLHATYFGGLRRQATKDHSPDRLSFTRSVKGEGAGDEGTKARRHEGTKGDQYRDSHGAGVAEGTKPIAKSPNRQITKSEIGNRQSAIDNSESGWELEPDYEARVLWASVTDIDPTHIHAGGMKDNFWEMGDTGPCGPCSEIHIDLTPDKSGGPLVNAGDARVMEIWNLVFIQFNRAADGTLTPLPAKHVDTGMGFERLCAVLQGMDRGRIGQVSNYDTDVFTPIFEAIRRRTGAPRYQGTLPGQAEATEPRSHEATEGVGTEARRHEGTKPITKSPNHQIAKSEIDNRQSTMMRDVSYRVVADHLRCLTFAITDGAMPSNEGRGYVLRRILRRAVRYGRQYLNMHEPFLCDLVEPLVAHMSEAFPELKTGPDRRHPRNNVQYVADILREEEASFLKTLDRGIRLFNEAADYARTHHHGRIGGEAAFKLHDTYGFPIDLTEQMAEEQGLTVDIGEYERLMDEARRRARSASTVFSEQLIEDLDLIPETRFVGYERTSESNTVVQAIVRNGELVDELGPNQEAELCLTCTPFYAEQGGQVGDKGVIQGRNRDWSFEVIKTRKIGDWYLHFGRCTRGRIVAFQPTSPGYVWSETPAPFTDEEMHLILEGNQVAAAVAEVAQEFRRPTMQNHTSTHLLNWALRDVLGPHVDQKGSLVDPEKTRFDFSHPKAVAAEELDRIESLVNEKIRADLPVFTQEVDQKRARQVKTLRAVFGEKYPERVRVVSIGARIGEEDNPAPDTLLGSPDDPKWMQYSVEFCGGTHLKRTGEAEHFVLTHEEAVAKGIRRVVGISGEAAHRAESDGEELLAEVEALCGRAGSARHRRDRECHQTPTETAGEARPTSKPSRDPNPSRNPNPSRDREGADASEATKPRPRDATMVADFQVRLAAAVIPIRVRRRINERLAELQKEIKEQEKEVAAASADQLMDRVRELLKIAETRGGVTIVIGQVPPAPPEAFRLAVDFVRQKAGSSAVLLATVSEGNVTLLAGMSKDLVERGIKAGDLIKEICPIVGGKGGGRPDMAQGGGTEVAGIGRAVAQALEWLRNRISQ